MDRSRPKSELISFDNISYYDKIADQYDTILHEDEKNILIRNRVAKYFVRHIHSGNVLDFGGGTGLDLPWLVQQPYCVSFCEPSESMRQLAIQRRLGELRGSSLEFLEGEQSDFRNWNAEFPFRQKINAVLANFAVVNCIPDIHYLFEKLAFVLDPGGMVVALVLDGSLPRKFRSNLKGTLRFLFTGHPVGFNIEYNGRRQLVNLYSPSELRKASIGNFHLVHHERWQGFGFSLIHLVRK